MIYESGARKMMAGIDLLVPRPDDLNDHVAEAPHGGCALRDALLAFAEKAWTRMCSERGRRLMWDATAGCRAGHDLKSLKSRRGR